MAKAATHVSRPCLEPRLDNYCHPQVQEYLWSLIRGAIRTNELVYQNGQRHLPMIREFKPPDVYLSLGRPTPLSGT